MANHRLRGPLMAALLLLLPVLLMGAAQGTEELDDVLPYLFAVYAITWAGFFAYAFFLSRKQAELRREVEALRQALGSREEEPPSAR